jgi:TPR repeat protein
VRDGAAAAPINQALAASARQGNPRAELALGGQILARARTPDERQAGIGWIRQAAEADLASAQNRLGWMYLNGNGVPQDTATALHWLQRAAKHGAPSAQLRLGQLYATGDLVPLDKAKAYYWYSVAAKPARSDVTIFNIQQVRHFARRDAQAFAESLTPAERAAADQQVAAWTTTPGVPYSGSVLLASFVLLTRPAGR